MRSKANPVYDPHVANCALQQLQARYFEMAKAEKIGSTPKDTAAIDELETAIRGLKNYINENEQKQ